MMLSLKTGYNEYICLQGFVCNNNVVQCDSNILKGGGFRMTTLYLFAFFSSFFKTILKFTPLVATLALLLYFFKKAMIKILKSNSRKLEPDENHRNGKQLENIIEKLIFKIFNGNPTDDNYSGPALRIRDMIFRPAVAKGNIGEIRIARILAKLPQDKYRVINDLMLRTSKGTVQFDHLVISRQGIFVIETKNYQGSITGSEYDDTWVANYHRQIYRFKNPIKQNYGHVKALEEYLQKPSDIFNPVVVFLSPTDLNLKVTTPVITQNKLSKWIVSFAGMKLSEFEVAECFDILSDANITIVQARVDHKNTIRAKINDDQNQIRKNICPCCGAPLVQRKSKYGHFMGCSNYPKCRFIANDN